MHNAYPRAETITKKVVLQTWAQMEPVSRKGQKTLQVI
jgi:hypothetical protein